MKDCAPADETTAVKSTTAFGGTLRRRYTQIL